MPEKHSRWNDMKYRSLEIRHQCIGNGVSNCIVVEDEVRGRMNEHELAHKGSLDYSE